MENQFFSYKPELKDFLLEKPILKDGRFQKENGQTIHLLSKRVTVEDVDLQRLKEAGIANLIVPISWQKAHQNEAHLKKVDEIVKKAKKHNIWVTLDVDLSFPDYILDEIGFDLNTTDLLRGYVDKVAQTLFLDGANVAPQLRIHGKLIHLYMQHEYATFLHYIAKRYAKQKHVVAIKVPESPEMGLLNHSKLRKEDFEQIIKGESLEDDKRVWKDSVECPWKKQNVWQIGKKNKPELLFKKHFTISKGRRKDAIAKFHRCARKAIESARADKIFLTKMPFHEIVADKAYPLTICGSNHMLKQQNKKGQFSYQFNRDHRCNEPVRIFLPLRAYDNGFHVSFTSGKCKFDKENSMLLYFPGTTKKHHLLIEPKIPLDPMA